MLKRLRLVDILVPRNRREPMKGRVASIARTMQVVGQLHPIVVNAPDEDGGKHRLIAGRTRYDAAKLLDQKDILCNVVEMDKLHAEMAEIVENLERTPYSILEEAQKLARLKQLYLEIYPETQQGGDRKSEEAKSKPQNAVLIPPFAEVAGDATGRSDDTIQRSVAIGENIAPAAAKIIKDTPIADNKGQLQQLVKLGPEQQVEVAEAIKSGEADSVKEAIAGNGKPKRKVREKPVTPADEAKAQVKIWADTVGRWLGKSPSIDELRGKFPGKQGDAVVTAATTLFEALKTWQKALR
jgi:ParB family chromosome partitioning protein